MDITQLEPSDSLDLPLELFPIHVTAFVDDEAIWERVLDPPSVVDIPAPRPEHLGRIRIRLACADGQVAEHKPVPANSRPRWRG